MAIAGRIGLFAVRRMAREGAADGNGLIGVIGFSSILGGGADGFAAGSTGGVVNAASFLPSDRSGLAAVGGAVSVAFQPSSGGASVGWLRGGLVAIGSLALVGCTAELLPGVEATAVCGLATSRAANSCGSVAGAAISRA